MIYANLVGFEAEWLGGRERMVSPTAWACNATTGALKVESERLRAGTRPAPTLAANGSGTQRAGARPAPTLASNDSGRRRAGTRPAPTLSSNREGK